MNLPSFYGGRFTVVTELVRRPSSVLLRATDKVLGGREVALKVFLDKPAGSGKWIADFDRQIGALRRASHPALVPIIAGGYEDGFFFFAMELLTGGSLRQMMQSRSQPFDQATAVRYIAELCEAVHELHLNNLVHAHIDSRAVLFKGDDCRLAGFYPPVIAAIQKAST
ncbi:MAG: protein kinase, partial [Bdellovibrionales bacterium]|nr:protein kinase [Bdellovibrionales bacterium]